MDDAGRGLTLTNTLTRRKEPFRPIDWREPGIAEADRRVRMYVCGPTVYDYAHIGNARPVIVFDVLYRLLRHLYGASRVTYVRNITDVDDKINARALRDHPGLPLNEAIARVTAGTTARFHRDAAALGCLEPTVEPRATDFVTRREDGRPDMVSMIETLVARGNAYRAGGEVLFAVDSMPDYGSLSRRKLNEQLAGARVAVDAQKRNPADFVLWKLSSPEEPGWDSPWGRGRPGWHIECSVMSAAYLGTVFDIHGGGLDLIFPHHENEIAQSRCAHGTHAMAEVWLHNGFVQVDGHKMSKSDGNFITISELLNTKKIGGRKWGGAIVRLAMLKTNYREPIDFTVTKLEESESNLEKWTSACGDVDISEFEAHPDKNLVQILSDDINTSEATHYLSWQSSEARSSPKEAVKLAKNLVFLGLADSRRDAMKKMRSSIQAIRNLTKNSASRSRGSDLIHASKIDPRGVLLNSLIAARLAFLKEKNFSEADAIRATLMGQGIVLKDGKNPATGERITTWEKAR